LSIIRLSDESKEILVLEGGGGVGENLLARFIDFAKKKCPQNPNWSNIIRE
jgi:predicted glycosyltransferase